MKKIIAILLCMVMMVTFIPTVFASAAPASVVAAEDAATGDTSGGSGMDLSWLGDFWELITGFWDKLGGDTIIDTIKAFAQKFLEVVSLSEFFDSIKAIWNDVK